MGPGITSDPGRVVSGNSHSSVYFHCIYRCSLITFCLFYDEKKWFYIFFISVLEKESIRNSTLVFDDCFLPLKYLRFERIIRNLFVVTFFESMLFFVCFSCTKGDEGEVVGEWKNGKSSKGVLGLFSPFQTISYFLFGFTMET